MKKLVALILSSLLVAGCAQSVDDETGSLDIQPSEQTSQDTEAEGGLTDEEKQALLDKIAEDEALAEELRKNTEDAEARNNERLGGLIWPANTVPLNCNADDFDRPTSLESLDICGTFLSAWNQIWSEMEQNPPINAELATYISPAMTADEMEKQTELIESSTRLWGANFWPEGRGRMLFMFYDQESEMEWFTGKVKEWGGLPYMFSGLADAEDWYLGEDGDGPAQCGALASQGDNYYTLLMCLGRDEPDALKILPHEYTHWYHGQFGELTEKGPLWFIEGAAEFYGIAIGFKDEPRAIPYRSFLYSGHSIGYAYRQGQEDDLLTTLKDISENDFVRLMRQHEDKWTGDPQFSYFVGGMATEALIAVYGADVVDRFSRSFSKTSDWKGSFREIFGIDEEEFYRFLHPYVAGTAAKMRILD